MKRYEIYKHIGNLSRLNNGWIKELNLISWDNKEPVYDIRTWNSEHTEYGKGVTITSPPVPRNNIGCSPILPRAACIYFPIL